MGGIKSWFFSDIKSWLFSIIVGVGIMYYGLSDNIKHDVENSRHLAKQEEIANGSHWLNDCSLLEINIDTGWFSGAQNRLQCGETIVNVDKADYDSAVASWQKSTLSVSPSS